MPSAADSTAFPPSTPPLWLLVLIIMNGTMAMHMFVPALPAAAVDLHASAGQMQMTIGLYILGLAAGQLIYGPLSDAYGRRPWLIAGLVLYALAGALAALAPGVQVLLGARLLQALGGCAGLVLGRAIVRDTTTPEGAVKQLALVNLMMMISPGFAPVIGGLVAAACGWRAIFWVLAFAGLAALVCSWRLMPETTRPTGRLSVATLAADYKALLGSPVFVGYALGGACATTSMYAFIATAPFIFVTELHRPVQEIGVYMGLLMSGAALGNLLTSRLILRTPIARLLRVGNLLGIAGAACLLATMVSGHPTVAMTVGLMIVYSCGAGMVSPAAMTKAMSVDPRRIGSAAGLYGFSQMTIGGLCTALVTLGSNPAISAAGVLLAAALLAQWGLGYAVRRERPGVVNG